MADNTQDIKFVKDGQSGTAHFPSDWSAAQIDTHLKENGARRLQSPLIELGGGVKIDVSADPFFRYVQGMTPTQKAITAASFAVGGPGVGLGVKLGGTVALERAGQLLPRLYSGALQTGKLTAAGGAGAAVGQQLGDTEGIKQGAMQGLWTSLTGLGSQALLNSVSKMLMGHISQSFLDSQGLKNFLVDHFPAFFKAKDNAAQLFTEVYQGKLKVAAQQVIQQAVDSAARGSQGTYVHLPEVAEKLTKYGLNLEPGFQQGIVDYASGAMPIKTAMDAHAALARFATKEGALLTKDAAVLVQNIRDDAERRINAVLGPRASALWDEGKLAYLGLRRIHQLLSEGDPRVFVNGVPDLSYLQEKFTKQFGGKPELIARMGRLYDDLQETVFRQGNVLVRDVPGFLPSLRAWLTGGGHPGGTVGLPMPAKLAGVPGEIPAVTGPAAVGLIAPALVGGAIPTSGPGQ